MTIVEIVQLLLSGAAFLSAGAAFFKAAQTHRTTNSKMDLLILKVEAAAEARGRDEQRAKTGGNGP